MEIVSVRHKLLSNRCNFKIRITFISLINNKRLKIRKEESWALFRKTVSLGSESSICCSNLN